jgi:hypothetical protein
LDSCGALLEDPDAPDPPVGKVIDVRDGQTGSCSAGSPGGRGAEEGDHPIGTDGLDAVGIEAEVRSRVLDLREEAPDAGPACIGSLDRAAAIRGYYEEFTRSVEGYRFEFLEFVDLGGGVTMWVARQGGRPSGSASELLEH